MDLRSALRLTLLAALTVGAFVSLPEPPKAAFAVSDQVLLEYCESASPPGLPTGWATQVVTGSGAMWDTCTTSAHPPGMTPGSGPAMLRFNSFSAPAGSQARLYQTADIDATRFSTFRVNVAMHVDPAAGADQVEVQVSTDGGTSWTTVGTPLAREYPAVTSFSFSRYPPATYDHSPSIRFALLGTAAGGNDCHVDIIDVTADPGPYCSPEHGALGSVTRIRTTGSFGAAKGKLLSGGKTAPLKVLTWADKEITAVLSKDLAAGAVPLTVLPKGLPAIDLADPFEVVPPEVQYLASPTGSAGSERTIALSFHGTKKGKLYFESDGPTPVRKACKVLEWVMAAESGNGTIRFIVPTGLPPGTYDVVIARKLLATVVPDAFTLVD